MRAIVCELCGSNDLVKDGSVYVCQHCGTKYTTEEARKLLVEASVTVVGPIGVDGIAGVDNLLRRASDFEGRGDYERAIEYYDRVLDLDIDNPEANRGMRRAEAARRRAASSTAEPKAASRRRVDGPNLTVDFSGGNPGSLASIYVDGKKAGSIWGGKTAHLTLSQGKHTVGVAGGVRRCKDPVAIVVDGFTAYRMTVQVKGLSFLFNVTEG